MSERDIFNAAREMTDPAARSAYLDRACGGDRELRSRVEALLRAHDRPDSLLDHPAAAPPGDFMANTAGAQAAGLPAAEAPTVSVDPDAKATNSEEEPLSFLAPSARRDSLGRLGHYEVLQVLGRGGFGIVFRAFDETLRRVVALKVMTPELAATSPARKRFLREARSSAQVRHENVVQVYEVAEQPLPYLAMEFIPGETLQQRLDRVGPLDVPEVLHIGRQIAEGLAAAHATDLIHRDIKPGNLLLEGGQQKVKITDFGLARAADDASISQSGIVAGTPMYMAPEQAMGQTLDQRADLFSLGSVLYQMASGRPPFRANSSVAVLMRVAEDTPRPIREIIPETPQWLCDIIAKLHAKNPDDRYQSAREVADVLADCEAQLKANAKLKDYSRIPRGESQRSRPRPRFHSRPLAAAAALLLLLFGGLGFTEATGVTDFRGTVIRLFAPEGTLVVEVDDPGVSIKIDESDIVITGAGAKEIRLKPGRYTVEASKDGKLVTRKLVTVTTNGKEVVRISQEAKPIALSSPEETPEVKAAKAAAARAAADAAAKARARQEAAAKQLGVEIETTNSIGMKLRLIPAGTFTMGSSKEEIDHSLRFGAAWDRDTGSYQSESPEHQVEITRPFYLATTEVTVGQFRQFVESKGYRGAGDRWRDPGFDQTDNQPVVYVSWDAAVDLCKWLSEKEGQTYRLPTEAEWEYCCRAGKSGTRYCYGDDDARLEDYAWYEKNSGGGTHPVGKKRPNDWGLHDMHGNAGEWCQDYYGQNYYKRSPVKDPIGPDVGGMRVRRGGTYNHHALSCRTAFRPSYPGDGACDGFRVLLVLPSGGIRPESGAKDKPSSTAIARFTDADVRRIAAMPAARQVEEVRKELERRNSGFDGKMETKVEGGVVTELRIVTDEVADIAPIRVFDALRVLDCRGTYTYFNSDNMKPNGRLADLTPLEGMNLAALTYLNLSGTKVGDAGLANFKDCKALTNLFLGETKVSDAGLANFKDCKNLSFLRLVNTQVGDAGMVHFRDCKALTDLYLARTKVSDAGLVNFKDCKNLQALYLDHTQVGDAGLAQFKGMPLGKLAIDHTGITDLAPLQGMSLEDIRLTPKNITKGLDILCDMKSLKTIGISWESDKAWPAAEFWERYDRGEFK